jgi:hypothetical protein
VFFAGIFALEEDIAIILGVVIGDCDTTMTARWKRTSQSSLVLLLVIAI